MNTFIIPLFHYFRKKLPPGILCVDSLKVFRRIDEYRIAEESARIAQQELDILAVPLEESKKSLTENSSAANTATTEKETDIKELLNDDNDWFIANAKEMQQKNETTPSNRPEKHEKGRLIRHRALSSDDSKTAEVNCFSVNLYPTRYYILRIF